MSVVFPRCCQILLSFLVLLLAACGGGGGGSAPVPVVKARGTAALIEAASGGDAESPQIACDASDNALAVWSKSDGIRNDIWANRYTAGSGWDTATLLQAGTTGRVSHYRLAGDPSGNALSPQIAFDGRGNA